MKRRIFSMIMAVCLIISLASVGAVTAYADEYENVFYINHERARIGTTVNVPVSASNADEFACLTFKVDYDLSALELMDVTCNIPSGNFLYNGDPSNPQFIWYNTENTSFELISPIFVMTFKVRDDAQEGTYPVTLLFDEGNMCNENGSRLPLRVEAGALTVFRYITGDVNGDFLVDSADVVMLARYIVGMETEVNTYGADVNKDGSIDGRDLVKLARHMVGMEMIEDIFY